MQDFFIFLTSLSVYLFIEIIRTKQNANNLFPIDIA